MDVSIPYNGLSKYIRASVTLSRSMSSTQAVQTAYLNFKFSINKFLGNIQIWCVQYLNIFRVLTLDYLNFLGRFKLAGILYRGIL